MGKTVQVAIFSCALVWGDSVSGICSRLGRKPVRTCPPRPPPTPRPVLNTFFHLVIAKVDTLSKFRFTDDEISLTREVTTQLRVESTLGSSDCRARLCPSLEMQELHRRGGEE